MPPKLAPDDMEANSHATEIDVDMHKCKCDLCGTVVSLNAQNSLWNFRNQHWTKCPKRAKPAAGGGDGAGTRPLPPPMSVARKRVVDDAWADVVVEDCLPLGIGESAAMRRFTTRLTETAYREPYQPPSRWRTTSIIEERWDDYEDNVQKLFDILTVKGVTVDLEIDGWTGGFNSYLGVAAGFALPEPDALIGTKVKIWSLPLALGAFGKSHTTENMKDWLTEKKTYLHIPDGGTVLGDGANNMQALVEEFCPGCGHGSGRCLVHFTHKLLQHASKPFKGSIAKLQRAVVYVQASPLRRKTFHKFQHEDAPLQALLAARRKLDVAKLKKPLTLEIEQRGQTRFLTLQRETGSVIIVKNPLTAYYKMVFDARPRGILPTPTAAREKIEAATPTAHDWEDWTVLNALLKKTTECIGLLQTGGMVTASLAIPLMRTLAQTVARPKPTDCAKARAFKEIIMEEANDYKGLLLKPKPDGTPSNPVQALFFDKDFNTWSYIPQEEEQKAVIAGIEKAVEEEIRTRMARAHPLAAAPPAAAAAADPPPDEHDERAKLLSILKGGERNAAAGFAPPAPPARNPRHEAIHQVNTFRKRSTFPVATTLDPLTWINANKEHFPDLAALATRRLAAPATSIGCERFFSVSGQILSPLRSVLTPRHLEMMSVLKASGKKMKELMALLF